MTDNFDASGSFYARVRDLFSAAVEIDEVERDAWLDTHVTEPQEKLAVRRLLDADASTSGFFEKSAEEHAAHLLADDAVRPESLIGQSIGSFRLVRVLGKGGMAVVFLGEREGVDFVQRVAVKLLRRGLFSDLEQRLFRRERQLLAGLQHPNIARLIDGGVTNGGIPYLVLEFVDGIPITDYASTNRLSPQARLRLFLVACQAVQAAHASLIVHRDLKPSNILVAADGTPKLLDFGIAKFLEDDIESPTAAVFTPDYAAPEQIANLPPTAATDVYGLGVLLHELLVGVRPMSQPVPKPSTEVEHTYCARAALPDPTTLKRVLRGDLDNIIRKALEEDPLRRYATAGALADDIDAFLDQRPVAAHPVSRRYRAGKFVRRHRTAVIATSLFFAAIVGTLGVAMWQAQVARREAAGAALQAERANSVRDFVLGVFDSASAHLPQGQRPTPETLVDRARSRVAEDRGLDSDTRAQLLASLGEVDLSLSNFARAAQSFDTARSLTHDLAEQLHLRVLTDDAWQRAGRNADAQADLELLLPLIRSKAPTLLPRALSVMAEAQMQLGRPDDAVAHRREAVAIAERQSGPDSTQTLAARFDLGNTFVELQNYPAAIEELQTAAEKWRDAHHAEDDRYVLALENTATAEDGVGDVAASETRYRDLLALKRRIYPASHDAIAKTLRQLGLVVARREDYAQARALLEEAAAMNRQIFGSDHAEVVADYDARGELEVAQRHFAEADAAYRDGIKVCERAGIKDEVCPHIRADLGMSLYRQRRLDDALDTMNRALDERRALFGNAHPSVAFSLAALANVAVFQQRNDDAVRLSAEALEVMQNSGRGASRDAALIRNGYAQALWVAGNNDEALREIDRTLADWQQLAPEGRVRRVMMLVLKAQIQADMKRIDDARATALQAIAMNVEEAQLSPAAKDVLRKLSGRNDIYIDQAK